MSFRAIFYDLDGTLRVNVPNGWRVFTDYAHELGVLTGEQDRLRVARWEHYYFAESPELRLDRQSFQDNTAFWSNFSYRQLTELGASHVQALELAPRIHQYMVESYRPQDVIPDRLIDTLKDLKSRGYQLGVFSNRDISYTAYLSGLGLGEIFDLVTCAGEAGAYKPNPEAFRYLLDRAGVSAVESVYVGDNYYADVVGARAAGMTPVLLDFIGLFSDPDCPVIQSHDQILKFLERSQ